MSEFDIEEAIVRIREYVNAYAETPYPKEYPVESFINYMIYGLGLALDAGLKTDEFSFADGYDRFKTRLQEYLDKGAHIGDWTARSEEGK